LPAEPQTITLDDFLTALAMRLAPPEKGKDRMGALRELFTGTGKPLEEGYGFRHGGLVDYITAELDNLAGPDMEAQGRLRTHIPPHLLSKITTDFFTGSRQSYFWLRDGATQMTNGAISDIKQPPSIVEELDIPTTREFSLAVEVHPNNLKSRLALWRQAHAQTHIDESLKNVLDDASELNLRLPEILELLAQGANVNTQNRNHWTSLHWAVRHGTEEDVQAVLEYYPDVNLQKVGMAPLHFAAQFGTLGMVQAILAHNPNVNLQDNDGWTSLHYATRYGTVEKVQAILAHNPDMNLQTITGKSGPLHYATHYGTAEMVQAILTHNPNVNLQDKPGFTPLHYAIIHGKMEMVKALLDAGADPTIRTFDKLRVKNTVTLEEKNKVCPTPYEIISDQDQSDPEIKAITDLLHTAEIEWKVKKAKTSDFTANLAQTSGNIGSAPAVTDDETLSVQARRHHAPFAAHQILAGGPAAPQPRYAPQAGSASPFVS